MKSKNEITKGLGVKLKYYRVDRGLSLSELSDLSEVSASYIHRIENGERRSPSIVLLNKISKALAIPIESLLDISREERELELQGIDEVILGNNFMINKKAVEMEVKIKIIELLEFIISSETVDRNKMIYELLGKVDELKC